MDQIMTYTTDSVIFRTQLNENLKTIKTLVRKLMTLYKRNEWHSDGKRSILEGLP